MQMIGLSGISYTDIGVKDISLTSEPPKEAHLEKIRQLLENSYTYWDRLPEAYRGDPRVQAIYLEACRSAESPRGQIIYLKAQQYKLQNPEVKRDCIRIAMSLIEEAFGWYEHLPLEISRIPEVMKAYKCKKDAFDKSHAAYIKSITE